MGTRTEKFNLYKPAVGETGWGTLVSDNFQTISELTAEDWGAQSKLTFDTTPTSGSSNPVTSNGIKTYADTKQPKISGTNGTVVTYTSIEGKLGSVAIESSPTTSTNKLVTSAGIKTAIDAKQGTIPKGTDGNVVMYTGTAGSVGEKVVSDSVTSTGTNLVNSKGIYAAIEKKQAKLSGTSGNVVTYTGTAGTLGSVAIDSSVSSTSTNLVTSKGIYSAIDAKQTKLNADTNGNVVTYTGTAGKLSSLGFDSSVAKDSTKLVKSGTVYTYGSGITSNLTTLIESKPTILKGTEEPSASLGKDGDIYIQYTE